MSELNYASEGLFYWRTNRLEPIEVIQKNHYYDAHLLSHYIPDENPCGSECETGVAYCGEHCESWSIGQDISRDCGSLEDVLQQGRQICLLCQQTSHERNSASGIAAVSG